MSAKILYAWATPAFVSGSPVDHTWVTSYDNRISPYADDQAVAASGENYWFCWGSFHQSGGTPAAPDGYLGSQAANIAQAICLVAPNADSRQVPAARGTIFTYGVDGVCHQLANQVLYATGSAGSQPLKVSNARGYFASNFLYGTYGLQHSAWQNKISQCVGAQLMAIIPGAGAPQLPDEFEQHLRRVLGPEQDELIVKLLASRDETHRQRADVMMPQEQTAVTAETLNSRNQQRLAEAAAILGPEQFEKVFGFKATEAINLVDEKVIGSLRDA